MELVVLWVIFAIVAGLMAVGRGRRGFLWTMIGVVATPPVAFLVLYALPKRPFRGGAADGSDSGQPPA